MTTTTIPPEVDAYLARVGEALSDLPAAERDDLLADVEASVFEAAQEGSVAARLGQPEDFAAELRAAAGLQQLATLSPPRGLRGRASAALAHPRVVELRSTLTPLAPIWWVARAYVVVAAVALWLDVPWSTIRFAVPLLGNGIVSVVAIVAAAAASIWLGFYVRRSPRSTRRVAAVANAVIVLAALPVLAHLLNPQPLAVGPVEQAQFVEGLSYDGIPIDNIYPYTRDGQLLHDVLLYDSVGRPLDVRPGAYDPDRRLLETADGTPIFNSFPVRYFEPGTTRVERPDAAPLVKIPEIETPPLAEGD